MILNGISLLNYRNLQEVEIAFSPKINCLIGSNGMGKTNLLDAVYYLSFCKSAINASDSSNIMHDAPFFMLQGYYCSDSGVEREVSCGLKRGEKKQFRRDGKLYERLSDHIGSVPLVMVSPADVSMVSESGEERRRFVNAVLSQMDREYMSAMQQYNRLLLQRNKMLKDQVVDRALLEVIDMRMSALAQPIYEARKRFVDDLRPIVAEYYKAVSGDSEQVDIQYESELADASLESILSASFEKDRIMKHTTSGVHRDDFAFTMNGHPIRRFGSQGQQKSFLVSLKFAQYEIMKRNYGFAPILLLDDVFDKLDMGRISNLLQMVASNDFGQIFITDSNKVRMAGIVDGLTQDRAYFETSGGMFTRI